MAQCGMLRNYRFTNAAEDIRGSQLHGLNDERLGKIEDVIFEHATGNIRYVVVDTGGWLSSKKFIVPAQHIVASVEHQDDFSVNLTKRQIERFPLYKESDLESDEQWADYEGRYRAQWKTGPVMHRAETDRDITPTRYQEGGNLSSERASRNLPAIGRIPAFPGPAGTSPIEDGDALEGFAASPDTVAIDNSAVGDGGRWDTFQDRLRERRKEVIGIPSEYGKAS
jgi:PRC-barrel domain